MYGTLSVGLLFLIVACIARVGALITSGSTAIHLATASMDCVTVFALVVGMVLGMCLDAAFDEWKETKASE